MRPDVDTINLLIEVAELAATKALIKTGKLSQDVSYREAGRMYGPAVVKRWKEEGLIEFKQDGPNAKIRIDRLRLEAVSKECNRSTYLTTKERTK
jgi:hypothetical protein